TLPLEAAAPLDWVAYCWLGVAFYAFLALLVLEPVRLLGNVVLRTRARTPERAEAALVPPGPSGEPVMTPLPRRVFLARGLAVTAGGVALGGAGSGGDLANSPPRS